MQSVKQDGIKYHVLSFWYNPTWTPVSQTIGEHTNHLANSPVIITTFDTITNTTSSLAPALIFENQDYSYLS